MGRPSKEDYELLKNQLMHQLGYMAVKEIQAQLTIGKRRRPSPTESEHARAEAKKKGTRWIKGWVWDVPEPANARETVAYAELRKAAYLKALELVHGTAKRGPLQYGEAERATEYAHRFVKMTSAQRQQEKAQWVESGEYTQEEADKLEDVIIKAGSEKLLTFKTLKNMLGDLEASNG